MITLVTSCFELYEPLIEKAVVNRRFTQLTNTKEVIDQFHKGLMQLWYCEDDNGECVILTTIMEYPETKILEANYVYGENIEKFFLEAYETLKDFGRANGCQYLRGFGRKGWLKLIPDEVTPHILWDVAL